MSTLDKKIVELREKKAIEDKVRLNERVYQKIIMSQMRKNKKFNRLMQDKKDAQNFFKRLHEEGKQITFDDRGVPIMIN
jgi:hypothetical protein